MTDIEKESVSWFCNEGRVEPLPRRPDGTVDYEYLCGEFLVEGVPFREVKFHYDRLPAFLQKT